MDFVNDDRMGYTDLNENYQPLQYQQTSVGSLINDIIPPASETKGDNYYKPQEGIFLNKMFLNIRNEKTKITPNYNELTTIPLFQ